MSLEVNRGNNNCIPLTGIGYVIIPENSDVAEYVQRCYRNNTLSIDGNGITALHNVKVVEGVLDKIKFPSNGSTRGSAVIWVRESFYNHPIIIGSVPTGGESNLFTIGQQRMIQEVLQRAAEIFIDGANSRVNILALGDDTTSGEVNVKASSKTGEGDAVNMYSNDFIRLSARRLRLNLTEDVELLINNGKEDLFKISLNDEKINVIDHWGNSFVADENEVHLIDAHKNEAVFNEEHIQFLTSKFDLGSGKEKMVLGNTLVNLLNELLDAIINMTVLTHAGPSGTPINAASFSNIKSKLDTILSDLSNTD